MVWANSQYKKKIYRYKKKYTQMKRNMPLSRITLKGLAFKSF